MIVNVIYMLRAVLVTSATSDTGSSAVHKAVSRRLCVSGVGHPGSTHWLSHRYLIFLHVSVYHSQCMQPGVQVLAQHAAVEAARSDVQRLEARERDVREVLQVGQAGQRNPKP